MMTDYNKALTLIEEQQTTMKKGSAPWCVGEQLKQMLQDQPDAVDVVAADLEQPGMGLADCEKKIAAFAQAHRQGNVGFCGPQDAERIIREFYGMPEQKHRQQAGRPGHSARQSVRLTDFL